MPKAAARVGSKNQNKTIQNKTSTGHRDSGRALPMCRRAVLADVGLPTAEVIVAKQKRT